MRPEIESGRMRDDRSVQREDPTRRGRRKRSNAPAWITDELVACTLKTWQPFYSRQLTRSDAIEILLAAGNLIDYLETSDEQAVPGIGPSIEPRAGA